MSRFSDVSFCIIDLLCQCCTSASHFFHPSLISRKRGKKHHSKPANFQTFSEVMLCVRIYYNIYIYCIICFPLCYHWFERIEHLASHTVPLWSVPFLSYIWAPSLESTQSSICHKTHSVTNGLAKCQKEQKARARLLTLWYTILHLYLPAFACMRHWHIIMGCSKNLWKIPLLFAVVQRLAKRFIPGWYWFILIYVDLCWFAWWSKKMWPPLYKPRRPSFTNLHWDGKVKNQNIQNARTLAIYSNIDIGIDHDCNIMAKQWNRNDSMRIEWDSSDSFSIWATSHVANESSQST